MPNLLVGLGGTVVSVLNHCINRHRFDTHHTILTEGGASLEWEGETWHRCRQIETAVTSLVRDKLPDRAHHRAAKLGTDLRDRSYHKAAELVITGRGPI